MPRQDRSSDGSLRIQWRTLALGACLVAVALLASAVVLINTSGDALASVALVLAILAFVIQIITFIADSFGNAQRDREAQRIYTKTRALLARIDEKSRQTNDTVREQYDKLLDRLLVNIKTTVGTEDTRGDDSDGSQSARLGLLAEVREVIDDARRQTGAESAPMRPRSRRRPESNRLGGLSNWPTQSTVNALAADGLNELDQSEIRTLKEFASDWRISAEADLPEGLSELMFQDESAVESLAAKRFLKFDESSRLYKLTGKGKAAARLFTSTSTDIPSYIESAFPWLREARRG